MSLSLGQCATLAALLEATIPKPGNVHRGADFEDLTFPQFVASAVALGAVFERAAEETVGRLVLQGVEAMLQWAGTNTHLGTILLLAPLARVPRSVPLESGIPEVLGALTPEDAHNVYEAIRRAAPGGLGRAEQMDVAAPPPADLLDAMAAAEDRDLVARQYSRGFAEVLHEAAAWIRQRMAEGYSPGAAVIDAHVRLMAAHPDSLIARKCGRRVAEESAARAGQVLDAGPPDSSPYLAALGDLDFWLRADGHRRNPGTTADLVAAGLFVLLRDGELTGPIRP